MDVPRGVLAKNKARILLVEDDPAVRRSLQLLLQANGFDVRAYANGRTLLADKTALDATCLVADYRMSDCDGVATLTQLRDYGWARPAILITAFPSNDLRASAQAAGFATVFEKPLRPHVLLKTIEQLLRSDPAG